MSTIVSYGPDYVRIRGLCVVELCFPLEEIDICHKVFHFCFFSSFLRAFSSQTPLVLSELGALLSYALPFGRVGRVLAADCFHHFL